MTSGFEESSIVGDEKNWFYKALLSSIDDALIATDKNLLITSLNKAAEKIYNIKAEDAIGRTGNDLFNYEYLDTNREEAIATLTEQNAWNGIVKLKRNDGVSFILQSKVSAVKDAFGEIIGYVGVNRDITVSFEEKQSLHNFISLLSSLEESYFIVDRDLKVVFLCLKKNVEAFYTSRYKIGDHALIYVPEHRKGIVYESYLKAFSGETSTYEFPIPDGEERVLSFNVRYIPLKDDFGIVTHVCIVIDNITAQKEFELLEESRRNAEQKLFESRKLFEDFMENSPLTAWIADEKGTLRYMNPPYLKYFGFTKASLGKSMYELFPKEMADEYFANNQKVIEINALLESIEKARDNNGIVSTFKCYKFPLHYNETTMVAGWAVNITDQIVLQDKLIELNKHKDRIVSVIAHDLRSHFHTNYILTQYLLDDYNGFSNEEILKYLQILNSNNSRAVNFLNELSEWVQNALNQTVYKPQLINLEREIEGIIQFLHKQSEDKNISIKTLYNTVDHIFADAAMFRTIVRNLVSNAIKFSPPGSEIVIETALRDHHIVLSVKDSGIGIDKILQNKIMSGLNYESSYGTKGEKGIGLGLTLTKNFIEKNGGIMWIESAVKKGSTFYFTVPIPVNH